MTNEITVPLRPNEVQEKFGISVEKLARYRRDGLIKPVAWSSGSQVNKPGKRNTGMALYDPEDVIKAFNLIVRKNSN